MRIRQLAVVAAAVAIAAIGTDIDADVGDGRPEMNWAALVRFSQGAGPDASMSGSG